MSKRPRLGDIFLIPVDDDGAVLGQLADRVQSAWFVIVFDGLHNPAAPIDLRAATTNPIRLQGITSHARIAHGFWRVVGNLPVDTARIRWPTYRTMTSFEPRAHVVINHKGEAIRPATWRDRGLPEMTTVSAMVVEQAVRALHKRQVWSPHFDDLLAPGARRP